MTKQEYYKERFEEEAEFEKLRDYERKLEEEKIKNVSRETLRSK